MALRKHVWEPHQRAAFRYAKRRKRIALFMEMRLGKSTVVIRWAKRLRARRVLLVAPLSTLLGKLNWQGELKRESIIPRILSALNKDKRMALLRPARLEDGMLRRSWARGWFAVNYEALRTQPELLAAPWDAMILDESTRIRSPRAQITKVLTKRVDHVRCRAILSGLPNPEDPRDYFSQFKFLHGHFMGFDNYWNFQHALFYQGYNEWDWQPRPRTRDKIKAAVHKDAFVLTRKQAKVGSSKVREQRSVELNAAQRRVLKEMKSKFAIGDVETKWVTVLHTWMQRVAGGFHPISLEMISDRKMRLTEELVMDQFRTQPLVIWFRFNEEIEAVYRWLRKRNRKLGISYVHGQVPRHKRPIIQERFHDGDIRIILMQVKIKFGWKLSRADSAIYYSNSYEFEDRSQSEDRIIHLKKRNPCLYIDLVTLGTPDEDVIEALSDKRITARLFNSRVQGSVAGYLS